MASIEHDRSTGLLVVSTDTSVSVLDRDDLAVVGAVLIRMAAAGRALTPELVWAALNPPDGHGD
jgi:hypothetical protein